MDEKVAEMVGSQTDLSGLTVQHSHRIYISRQTALERPAVS
jgi:hypothetical protein